MLRACKYRIYPTDEQKVLFAKTFGCCRFVYNWALNLKITAYKERKETLGNVYLTNLMKSELKVEHEWLSEVNSQSLQSSLRNLDTAYTNFFRNTKAVGFPRFKSRKDKQSFLCPQHCRVDFEKEQSQSPKRKIFLPCFAPQVQGYGEDRHYQHDPFGEILCFRSGGHVHARNEAFRTDA